MEADNGSCLDLLMLVEREEIRKLWYEVFELRWVNEILKFVSVFLVKELDADYLK